MKKVVILLVFMLLATLEIIAQTGIYGVIRDADSGEMLVGAAIYNDSLQKGTATNYNGYYDCQIAPGKYKIRFSYLGYTTIEQGVVIDNSRRRLNINMKAESQMLDNVVITSQKKDANVRELAMSVQKLEMVKKSSNRESDFRLTVNLWKISLIVSKKEVGLNVMLSS